MYNFARSCVFSHTEKFAHQEVKSKRVLNLFTAQLLGKLGFILRFSASPNLLCGSKNQKRITAGTHWDEIFLLGKDF
jgi:hypothetical protein